MDYLNAILPWNVIAGSIYVGIIVGTVVSLVVFEMLLKRWPRDEMLAKANGGAGVLGLIFLAMAAGGAIDWWKSGRLSFLNLAFFLTGSAGIGILADLIWRFRKGTLDSDEMRRIAAHDL